MPIVIGRAFKTIFHTKVNIPIDKNSFCCHTVILCLPVLLLLTKYPFNLIRLIRLAKRSRSFHLQQRLKNTENKKPRLLSQTGRIIFY